MDFKEKLKIRVEHWLEHNDKHCEEYSNFAKELQEHGLSEQKQYLERVVDLTKEISSLFKKILS